MSFLLGAAASVGVSKLAGGLLGPDSRSGDPLELDNSLRKVVQNMEPSNIQGLTGPCQTSLGSVGLGICSMTIGHGLIAVANGNPQLEKVGEGFEWGGARALPSGSGAGDCDVRGPMKPRLWFLVLPMFFGFGVAAIGTGSITFQFPQAGILIFAGLYVAFILAPILVREFYKSHPTKNVQISSWKLNLSLAFFLLGAVSSVLWISSRYLGIAYFGPIALAIVGSIIFRLSIRKNIPQQ